MAFLSTISTIIMIQSSLRAYLDTVLKFAPISTAGKTLSETPASVLPSPPWGLPAFVAGIEGEGAPSVTRTFFFTNSRTVSRYVPSLLTALLIITSLLITPILSTAGTPSSALTQYATLSLSDSGSASHPKILDRYTVPFVEGILPLDPGGSASVNVGGRARRIFLLGMNDSNKPLGHAHSGKNSRPAPSEIIRPAIPIQGWDDPRDNSVHFFIGDNLGQIRVNYADDSTQIFPLTLGESIWWGRVFYDYPEPFPSSPQLQAAFASALHLYPPAPVEDGNYVAVIQPKAGIIRSLTVENSAGKRGSVVIAGITVETDDTNGIAATAIAPVADLPPEFAKFANEKSLRPLGQDEPQSAEHLNTLRYALYSSDATFQGPVPPQTPPGYSGPIVSFKGTVCAEVLANVFSFNAQDIIDKIDNEGMYHTSTSNAPSWAGYKSFGTYRTNLGRYYDASYTRDMGRSLQEISALGFTNAAERCAEFCFERARLWESDTGPKVKNTRVPRHWGAYANHTGASSCFENDGHGLTSMFLYRLWQQLPDRDAWLRSHWADVKGAGDWILWQFDHPEVSGATNGVLHTTGESANGNGYSVYPDSICMNALEALAQMADSIGESNSAAQWRDRAAKMRVAILKQYAVNDPKYGRIWTLDYANWPHKSTVLGPLIFTADCRGFAPEDEDPDWHAVNEATYQRMTDTYSPFGFYGQAMGYGQGFVTESALLLDRMHDADKMLDWTAKEVYDPRFGSFIVPEGAQIDPTGHFWYRMGDVGNGVQEGEIVKTLRLVIGVDDTHPDRLQFFPRMPFDWTEINVEKYPVVFENSGKIQTAQLHYKLTRSGNGMNLEIAADHDLGPVTARLGPYEQKPEASSIQVNGKTPTGVLIEHNGDSWWARFKMNVRPVL